MDKTNKLTYGSFIIDSGTHTNKYIHSICNENSIFKKIESGLFFLFLARNTVLLNNVNVLLIIYVEIIHFCDEIDLEITIFTHPEVEYSIVL